MSSARALWIAPQVTIKATSHGDEQPFHKPLLNL
jgi:hypothetical protein